MGFWKKLFKEKKKDTKFCTAILVAAGKSTRMGGEDKILYELGGMPVLIHSLRPFEESELVDEIIIVTRRDAVVEISQFCKAFGMTKVTKILPGGATRMLSVLIGLG